MAIEHLPRPWLLAALADLPVTIPAEQEADESDAHRREPSLPRPEPRRRRLSGRGFLDEWPEEWPGEDYWRGVNRWRDIETERAN